MFAKTFDCFSVRLLKENILFLDFIDSTLTATWSLLELLVAICLIVFISGFLATHFISRYFRYAVVLATYPVSQTDSIRPGSYSAGAF